MLVGASDLHLVSGSDAIDAGEDLGSAYEIDIDGVARTGTWDIGADQFVAAGGAVTGSTQPTYIIGTIIGSIQ